MVYAGSKPLVLQASDIGKVFEIRTQEDLTEGQRRARGRGAACMLVAVFMCGLECTLRSHEHGRAEWLIKKLGFFG